MSLIREGYRKSAPRMVNIVERRMVTEDKTRLWFELSFKMGDTICVVQSSERWYGNHNRVERGQALESLRDEMSEIMTDVGFYSRTKARWIARCMAQ